MQDKYLILRNKKNLSKHRNSDGKKYFVDEQLPEAMVEARRQNRKMLADNRKKLVGQQQQMEIKKGTLHIEGKQYVKPVKPPTTRQIISIMKKQLDLLSKVNFKYSNTVQEDGSLFLAVALKVKCLKDIQTACTYLRNKYTRATHIACAFQHA